MRVLAFYHIACVKNWKDVVREQCTRLVFAGLYEKLDGIRCYAITGTSESADGVRSLLASFGKKFELIGTETEGDERLTLVALRQFVEPEDKVLYLHTKGVTRYQTTRYEIHGHVFHSDDIYANILQWRDLMEFHLVKEHAKCLDLLDAFDVVGVNYCDYPPVYEPGAHFSGNFWWATGRYLRSLPEEIKESEMWVMSNSSHHGRFAVVCQTSLRGFGHYFKAYPLALSVDR